jgi:peroxidase
MSETSLHGGSVGPTFGCILADQFSRLRRCDRFWFENNDPFVRFTPAQLAEIRKMTLAKIVCENSDSITHIQKEVMDVADDTAYVIKITKFLICSKV